MTNKMPDPVDLKNGEANEIERALASLENKRHYNKGWDDGFNFAFDCIKKTVNNLTLYEQMQKDIEELKRK